MCPGHVPQQARVGNAAVCRGECSGEFYALWQLRARPTIMHQRNLLFNDIAVSLYGAGKYDEATLLLTEVIASESDPPVDRNTRYHLNRGDCYRAQGAFRNALADYEVAHGIDAESNEVRTRLALIHNSFGTCLFNACKFAKAEDEFTLALRYSTSIPQVFLNRGNSLYHQHKFYKAFVDYERALAMEPLNGHALAMLSGGSFLRTGRAHK